MKFSVITPVYNAQRYLAECIESVIGQPFTDWEMILVDDGSSDGSLDVCRAFAAKDKRIRVFTQDNHGGAYTRNRGVSESCGEYFLFLDNDDYLLPDVLQRLFDEVSISPDAEVIHYPCELNFGREKRIVIAEFYHQAGKMMYSGKDAFNVLFSNKATRAANWQQMKYLIKRTYWESQPLRFTPGIIHEDLDFIPKFVFNVNNFRFADFPVYSYRLNREDSVSHAFSPKRVLDMMRVVDGHVSYWQEVKEDRLLISGFWAMLSRILWDVAVFTWQQPDLKLRDQFQRWARNNLWLFAKVEDPAFSAFVKRWLFRCFGLKVATFAVSHLR